MQYISMENTTMPVSKMIFGTAIAPLQKEENADELLDRVVEEGITTFDTARSYGQSEASFAVAKQREARLTN